ncbi:uncharacterized protein K444DRAFT_635365 [Hyaloscypha bicolor E]|uniref:Uncharacterized protein n=1 Tax=Hyaloscypha bicolor E TaxID=1095630 RepID=A0A2J6SS24_9HELO|nr:uncharacterized protein K444DRAFT_635365 [Hyaloscypha bicolor E]PMD53585.1 hypothetical protein K444DRAFT_635365 [Hyaloscypha bicolor E]
MRARRICVFTIAVWSLDVTVELRYSTASAVSYFSTDASHCLRDAQRHLASPTAQILPPSVPSSALIRFHTFCVVNKESGPSKGGVTMIGRRADPRCGVEYENTTTSSLPTPPLYRAKEFHQDETWPKIHEEKRGWIGVVDGKENRISSNIGKHQKSIRGVNNTTEEK